jgi:hypothetical protein
MRKNFFRVTAFRKKGKDVRLYAFPAGKSVHTTASFAFSPESKMIYVVPAGLLAYPPFQLPSHSAGQNSGCSG